MHRSAELRMRMGKDDGGVQRPRGLVEERFEWSGRADEISDGWHGRIC